MINTLLTQHPVPPESVQSEYKLPSMTKAITCLHAAAGFLTKATLLKAIHAGFFTGWPLLTVDNVNKHFYKSVETFKGHIKGQRQHVRSIHCKQERAEQLYSKADSPRPGKKYHNMYPKVHSTQEFMNTDQIRRFSHVFSKENQYLMVMVKVDNNIVDSEPTKDQTPTKMVRAYLALWTHLMASGMV